MNLDPLADDIDNFEFSPYNYAINNPIFFIDPDGMKWPNNNERDELISKVQSKKDELIKDSYQEIMDYLASDNHSDKKLNELNDGLYENFNRIYELNQSLEFIDLLDKDQTYTYDLTKGNSDTSHVKRLKNNSNILIEGTGTAQHLHEISHVADLRKEGSTLNFDTSGKLTFKGEYNKFVGELRGYRSEWGFSGRQNAIINSDGNISKGNWYSHKVNPKNVDTYANRYSRILLNNSSNNLLKTYYKKSHNNGNLTGLKLLSSVMNNPNL